MCINSASGGSFSDRTCRASFNCLFRTLNPALEEWRDEIESETFVFIQKKISPESGRIFTVVEIVARCANSDFPSVRSNWLLRRKNGLIRDCSRIKCEVVEMIYRWRSLRRKRFVRRFCSGRIVDVLFSISLGLIFFRNFETLIVMRNFKSIYYSILNQNLRHLY